MVRINSRSLVVAFTFIIALPGAGQAQPVRDIAKDISELRARIDNLANQIERERNSKDLDGPKLQRRLDELGQQRHEAFRALISALTDAPNLSKKEANEVLERMLEETIETKGLQEKVKLKTALEYFSEKFGGKIPILINRAAFADILDPDAPDPYEEEVSLPPVPSKMPMATALRLVLAQVGQGHATFLVRRGFIEITTLKASGAAQHLYQPSIMLTFKAQLLPDVLEQLADETGIAIHLDPKVGDKSKTQISAKFRNTTLEDALVIVTEMAELKFVVLERSIFVTTPERATVLRKEEKEREGPRKNLVPKQIQQTSKRWESGS